MNGITTIALFRFRRKYLKNSFQFPFYISIAFLTFSPIAVNANSSASPPGNSFAFLFFLLLVICFAVFGYLMLRVKKGQMLLQKEIEMNRMKSRYYANLSHEFRSPLTLILGPIEDMMARTESPKTRKYLAPIRKNAARLLELVNQLLELSKIESGKLKLMMTKDDIVSVVKGVVMAFESFSEMKKIRLVVIAGASPIEIFFDRDKIEKILANLLSNAFKFTPEKGNITVYIQITRDCHIAHVQECLQITVKDDGRGIPRAEIEDIFERFYQAEKNQHQQDGFGIGLALTKELVELHGGIIWANSEMNAGTEMHFQLPLNLDQVIGECKVDNGQLIAKPVVRIANSGEDFLNAAGIESEGGKPVVLLIEDNVDVRNYIHNTLENFYTVIEAVNGEQGVAVALDKIPDMILCDVMMPKMNGHQVCIALKKDERTSHVPVILLTGKADMESMIKGLETGADDYITKPFVGRELILRIKNLIESRQRLRDKYWRGLTLKPSEIAVNSIDEQFLKRTMQVLEAHMANDKFSVEDLGYELGVSRSHLHRKLKGLVGQAPNQIIRSYRLDRAHDMLERNAATAAEIAYAVGFSSPSYFTKCFHEKFGYTPSEIICSNQLPYCGANSKTELYGAEGLISNQTTLRK